MASQNPITLPLLTSSSKYAIPAVPKSYTGGNNVFRPAVSLFLDAGDGKLFGHRTLPETFDSGSAVKAVAVLSLPVAGSAGKKLRLEFSYHANDPRAGTAESKDPAAATQTVTTSFDIASWGAKVSRVAEFTLTATNLAAEDHLDYHLARYATHADDNYTDLVIVHELYLLATY